MGNPAIGSIYRHHTGRDYRVIAIAREADLDVDFVVHEGLHDGRVWVRSIANFKGEKHGKRRFEQVKNG